MLSNTNGNTISTGQTIFYTGAKNSCNSHCLSGNKNKVCGKGELCCNKITENNSGKVILLLEL